MPSNRPSLSAPTYGSLTGRINWSRGMNEQLAQSSSLGSTLVNATPAPAPAPAPAPSSGGRSIGGCPDIRAWVIRRGWFGLRRTVRAGSVKVGQRLLLIDGRWGRVSYSRRFSQPCRWITTLKGALCCSDSAPLRLEHGDVRAAVHLEAGQRLQTHRGLASILSNLSCGPRLIQLITCENDFYWCRSQGRLWFAHHNMKPLPGTTALPE